MKTIVINDRTLRFERVYNGSEWGPTYCTYFYEGFTYETIRSGFLGLFGPKIIKEIPKKIFVIYQDCDDVVLTKDWWKTHIVRQLELLDRKSQLKRGELI